MPCKFFKQGACQAGKSCPFSHVVGDTSDQAPCKYFQKGNCKFGAKCALAHILPDGRRVATAQNSQQNGHRKRREAPLDMGYTQAHNYPMGQSSSQSTAVLTHGLYPAPGASSKSPNSNNSPAGASSLSTTAIGVERSMSSSNSRLSGSAFMSIMASSADAHQHAGSNNNGSAFSSALVPSSPQSRSLYSIFGSPPYAGRGAPVSGSVSAIQSDRIFSSPPSARSMSGSIWNDPPTSLHNRISTTSRSYLEGSAIADDEDYEDEDNELAGFNDNDDDYEEMVPSALTDLLTPRERQRRDSRHASSSNWGSPRPILKQTAGNSDYRVEPIGTPTHSSLGPSINSPANGGLSSIQLGGPSPPSSWLQTVVNGSNPSTSIQPSPASHTPVGHDDETQFIMDEVYRK